LRIPYGLGRLPRDPTLRSVEVGDLPLRLNTDPIPADAMPLATGDHSARVAAALAWLDGLCGEYAPLRRQFVAAYFRFIAGTIDAHRAELAERLRQYDSLYAPEDFLWSALRPLPRGWVPVGEHWLPADMVFWDGVRAIVLELGARDSDRQRALLAAGVDTLRIGPADFDRLGAILPGGFHRFWDGETLPSSPFRRPIPALPVIATSKPVEQPP
jgi:hypothetical protein